MKRALIIAQHLPEPASSGAGLRMLELSQLLISHGWQLTYASTAEANDHSVDVGQLGMQHCVIAANDAAFDHFIAELKPDLVLFDRFYSEEQFGWRVATHAPDALRIIETIDLHFLRKAREQRCKGNWQVANEIPRDELLSEVALREIASIYRSDLSILVSDAEIRLLAELGVDTRLLHCCPFMLATDALPDPQSFEARQHFVTIGNFRHPPNLDAVKWLKERIWPLIRRQLPDAELHIYGAYMQKAAQALNDAKSGFLMRGRADDVSKVMADARICLAPLRYGAGIKTKLADAMLAGTPSVTTSVGAEGMHSELPWPGDVADDEAAFGKAAVALYGDQQRWQQAQADGFAIISARFDAAQNGSALMARIEQIRSDLAAHRLTNLTGAMLNYHHHRSTEFMSRWIEAKNAAAGAK